MVVHGVPGRLAKDAWWLDDETVPPRWLLGGLLIAGVGLADLMFWSSSPGIGFVVWVLGLAIAIHVTLWADVDRSRGLRAWGTLLVALVPAVELFQLSSSLIATLGLLFFSTMMVLGRWDWPCLLRAMRRMPLVGIALLVNDILGLRVAAPSTGAAKSALFDWAFPLCVGVVFIALIATANPVLDRWLVELAQWDSDISFDWERIVFWAVIGALTWPFLRLRDMTTRLQRTRAERGLRWRSGLLNDRSVLRALVVFNLIFVVQTGMDIGFLWGGVTLPEGMSYAEYAHRGAYPLLVTACLAGLFALLSQPYLETHPALRGLLYLWIAQNVLLVVSSILRLDLYVEVYDLTRLRFAAFVWMTLVALGLVLMVMQLVLRAPVQWFMLRAAGLGFLAVYVCALVNVDGLIARTNLARPDPDMWYLCELSEGAAPALAAWGHVCYSSQPIVSTPKDWREWGYRNARLRRSLAAMEVAQ